MSSWCIYLIGVSEERIGACHVTEASYWYDNIGKYSVLYWWVPWSGMWHFFSKLDTVDVILCFLVILRSFPIHIFIFFLFNFFSVLISCTASEYHVKLHQSYNKFHFSYYSSLNFLYVFVCLALVVLLQKLSPSDDLVTDSTLYSGLCWLIFYLKSFRFNLLREAGSKNHNPLRDIALDLTGMMGC